VTEYAMQTPDGVWRVEVVKRGRARWYRTVRGGNQLDWLSIAAVHRILSEAGVDMANLTGVTDWPPGPVDNANPLGCPNRYSGVMPMPEECIAARLHQALDHHERAGRRARHGGGGPDRTRHCAHRRGRRSYSGSRHG
jgi:hypothetical protein